MHWTTCLSGLSSGVPGMTVSADNRHRNTVVMTDSSPRCVQFIVTCNRSDSVPKQYNLQHWTRQACFKQSTRNYPHWRPVSNILASQCMYYPFWNEPRPCYSTIHVIMHTEISTWGVACTVLFCCCFPSDTWQYQYKESVLQLLKSVSSAVYPKVSLPFVHWFSHGRGLLCPRPLANVHLLLPAFKSSPS